MTSSFVGALNTHSRGVGKTRSRVRRPLPAFPSDYGISDLAEAALAMDVSSAASVSRTKTVSGAGTKRSYAKMKCRIGLGIPTIFNLCENVVERIQGIKQEVPNGATDSNFFPGYYQIGKGVSAGAGNMLMPLYICDLTRINNVSGQPTEAFQRLFIGDNGNPGFASVTAQLPTGVDTTSASFLLESYESNQPSFVCKNVQPRWYDIRMKLYGARKQSVTYDVMLVQFPDEWLIPNISTTAAPSIYDSAHRAQFWQQIARSCITNTIFPQLADWWKGLKVLRQRRFVLPASSSTDLDVNPESVDFKLFVKDTRVIGYRTDQVYYAADTEIDSMKWTPSGINSANSASTNDPVNYRKRTFLIIKATDMTATKSGAGDQQDDMDDTPSFDFVVRRKLRLLPSVGNL